LLKDALAELLKNDPLRLAGATAFFTTFALPPILVILIQALGIFFSTEKHGSSCLPACLQLLVRKPLRPDSGYAYLPFAGWRKTTSY
jgi:uncharacterized BrkB/YihY/UPF0761 family membrane protein